LENAFELSQEPLRSITSATQAEIEHHSSSGATVLPEIRLVVLSSALVRLHIDRGFIRLNVTSADQLSSHRGDHRDQKLANFQNPAVQRRAADFQADVSFQNHALPMQGNVVAIFADDRVDHDAVTRQALLDDPWWQGRRNNSEFLTRPASPFLSFRDQHEVLRWLHIQLGTLLVADHHSFFTATLAHALIWCARQYSLHARKVRRQFLAARMLAGSGLRAPHQPALALRPLDHFTDDRLKFEQFKLRMGKLFATRSILLDAHQPQLLFQHANPQLRVLQPSPQLCDEFQIGWC
jgi:hypothetical protein